MRKQLSGIGIASAALDARLLLQHALGCSHEHLAGHPEQIITSAEHFASERLLARRMSFEPVSRIIGLREFYGREFIVSPDVLDPRADSETLITQALAVAEIAGNHTDDLALADIGTGTGVLIITLLKELENSHGIAGDISDAALQVASANAERHGVSGRLALVHANWLDGIAGPFDIIISNPPYIETGAIFRLARDVAEFDPHLALDGGSDGLAAYRAILPAAYAKLKPGGTLCVEIGAGQDEQISQLFVQAGFTNHPHADAVTKDIAGVNRILTGWKS